MEYKYLMPCLIIGRDCCYVNVSYRNCRWCFRWRLGVRLALAIRCSLGRCFILVYVPGKTGLGLGQSVSIISGRGGRRASRSRRGRICLLFLRILGSSGFAGCRICYAWILVSGTPGLSCPFHRSASRWNSRSAMFSVRTLLATSSVRNWADSCFDNLKVHTETKWYYQTILST